MSRGEGCGTVPGMRTALCLIVMAVLMTGCTGCQHPSKTYMYKRACQALKDVPELGGKIKPGKIDQARISVGKNAGWVELPYSAVTEAGVETEGVHIIWFKRVARTWTVDRTLPRSRFAPKG